MQRAATFTVVLVAWVFFRAASLDEAMTVLSRIAAALPSLPSLLATYPWSFEVVLAIVLIGLLMLVEVCEERFHAYEWLRSSPTPIRWATAYLLLASLVLLGNWSLTRFVYMSF